MNELKFYKLAVWSMLLINIFFLTFFLMSKPKRGRHHTRPANNFQERVPEILNLDNTQQSLFNGLAEQHEQQIKLINKQQQQLLLPYFESIANSDIEVDTNTVLSLIEQLERKKLEGTYQHLNKVKNLLTEDQLPQFDVFMQTITERIVMKSKKNPSRPKD